MNTDIWPHSFIGLPSTPKSKVFLHFIGLLLFLPILSLSYYFQKERQLLIQQLLKDLIIYIVGGMISYKIYEQFQRLKLFCKVNHKRQAFLGQEQSNILIQEYLLQKSIFSRFCGTESYFILSGLLSESTDAQIYTVINPNQTIQSKKEAYIKRALQQSNQQLGSCKAQKEASNGLFDRFLIQLSQGVKLLSDPQCILCSQIFYQGHIISQNDSVCALSEAQFLTKQTFLKYIMGIVNNTYEGILICGISQLAPNKIKGFHLSKAKIGQYKNYIHQTFQYFDFKLLSYSYDFIRVADDYYVEDNNKKQLGQRYCVRIRVSAKSDKMIIYKYGNKGNLQGYNIFKLQKQIVSDNYWFYRPVEISMRKIAEVIAEHKRLHKIQKKKNNWHLNHTDTKEKAQVIDKSVFSNCLPLSLESTSHPYPELEATQYCFTLQQPTFPYTHKSLLIVGSEKKIFIVQKLKEHLINCGIVYQIERPFSDIIKKGGPVIFSFSFQSKPTLIKQVIKQFDKNKNITMIPITCFMKVNSKKFYQKQEKYMNFMKTWYPSALLAYDKGEQILIESDNTNALLLGYLWLQSEGIRPYLINVITHKCS